MFGFFASHEKRVRSNAANWIELAEKVWHFRKDVLPEKDAGELLGRTGELRQQLKARVDAAKLKLSIESLEGVLRRTGGAIYPKTSLVENVEFFLVAAIVILGIRTYFVQPFKIPTNSMWPTYHGMTAETFAPGEEAPGALRRVLRLVAFGAQRREVVAPVAGDVSGEFDLNTGAMKYTVQPGRTWLVLPTRVREYAFNVGGSTATVRVPLDFNDFDRVVWDAFFGGEQGFAERFFRLRQERLARLQRNGLKTPGDYSNVLTIPLKTEAKAGEAVLQFDILTGDQLFVDRVSYHFTKPKVGQGFVFRTGHIAGIGDDQYYIKRLVGTPGDVLEIKEPVLYRNGEPIGGAEAFDLNARRVPPYRGYFNGHRGSSLRSGAQHLLPGETVTVPDDGFFALGDNSGSSQDSRYWGFVPEKDAIGRPLFIYYPFTKRWGPAR